MSEQFLRSLETLDHAVVLKALKDLRFGGQLTISAAKYFFSYGRGIDESDPCTFQALCLRNNVNPDAAARAIWKKLPQETQNYLLNFFSKAGYTSVRIN
ncbi:MAG: hypothetical protein HYT65_01900 [Candidatus Yanofskybacteria bacterium]|nr:hypothetical protein [Candidatus Yanofskybacteria bacterium]